MLRRAIRTADLLLMGFVACGALIGGLVVLLVYAGEEITTAASLMLGGLALGAVQLWVWKRSRGRGETTGTRVPKE